MNQLAFLLFTLIPIYGMAQAVPPEKVVYEGEEYWRYQDQDTTYLATPYKWYYYRDSLGEYLGKSQKFPRDGKWICFYKQGGGIKVESIFNIRDSLYDGPATCFDFQQRIIEEYNFLKGQRHGYQRWYNENGQKKSEGVYGTCIYHHEGYVYMAIKKGEWHYWYPNGNLMAVGSYEKMEYTTWRPSEDDWPFIIAKRAPNWKYYDQQGKLVTKEYLNERGIFIEVK